MATPRHLLVDPKQRLFYHITSRCVRRSWLCGFDKVTQQNYNHRKQWFISRLKELTPNFSINVHAFAIMANHFHLIVEYDPTASLKWKNTEVAERWLNVCPPRNQRGEIDTSYRQFLLEDLVIDEARLANVREKLGSLSVFMKFLKQPIARRANKEDEQTGHFFDQRFYSGALLDKQAVRLAMEYVDLNPIRAKLARNIKECDATSVQARIHRRDALSDFLRPVWQGLKNTVVPKITFRDYISRLDRLIAMPDQSGKHDETEEWRIAVSLLHKRQRAYGAMQVLKKWLSNRSMRLREQPWP